MQLAGGARCALVAPDLASFVLHARCSRGAIKVLCKQIMNLDQEARMVLADAYEQGILIGDERTIS